MPRIRIENCADGEFDAPLDIRPDVVTLYSSGIPSPVQALSIRELEGLLGMTSEFPLVERLTEFVLSMADIEQDPLVTTQRLGLLFEALCPIDYIPERGLVRAYHGIEVNLKDSSKFTKAIVLITSFKYVKWRVANPRNWNDDCILIEGVFKK